MFNSIPYSDLPPGVSLKDLEPAFICKRCGCDRAREGEDLCRDCKKEEWDEDHKD